MAVVLGGLGGAGSGGKSIGTGDLTADRIPVWDKVLGKFVNSPLTVDGSNVSLEGTITFAPASANVGTNLKISEVGSNLILTDRYKNQKAVAVVAPYDSVSGSGRAHIESFAPESNQVQQPVDTSSIVAAQVTINSIPRYRISVTLPLVTPRITNSIELKADGSGATGVRVLLYRGSDDTGHLATLTKTEKQMADGQGVTLTANTPTTIQFINPFIAQPPESVYVVIESFSLFTLLGISTGVPWFSNQTQVATVYNVATNGGFTNLLTGAVAVTAGNPLVTGTNTTFLTDLVAGQMVSISGESHKVLSITSDTIMSLETNHVLGGSGVRILSEGKLADFINEAGSSAFELDEVGNATFHKDVTILGNLIANGEGNFEFVMGTEILTDSTHTEDGQLIIWVDGQYIEWV